MLTCSLRYQKCRCSNVCYCYLCYHGSFSYPCLLLYYVYHLLCGWPSYHYSSLLWLSKCVRSVSVFLKCLWIESVGLFIWINS